MMTMRTRMFDRARLRRGGLGLLLLTSSLGCATRGNIEVLESQLRAQEDQIRHYERDIAQLRNELVVSQRELNFVRTELADLGNKVAEEEAVHSLARTEGLVFNSLLTAGRDLDGDEADESFHANFYPHDAHGELVKLVGKLEIEAIDFARPPAERTIGRWEFTPDEARDLWHAGFLTSGYQVDLPWQQPPQGSKVLLLARLTARDGRSFEATQTLNIRSNDSQLADGRSPTAEVPGLVRQAAHTQAPESGPLVKPVPDPYSEPAAASSHPLDATPSRKVDPFDTRSLPDNSGTAGHSTLNAPVSSNRARPFPDGLQTSDSWTDATLPTLR